MAEPIFLGTLFNKLTHNLYTLNIHGDGCVVHPHGATGLSVVFPDQTHLVFFSIFKQCIESKCLKIHGVHCSLNTLKISVKN